MASKKIKLKEISLLKTVKHEGEYHPPGEVMTVPEDIADELIDLEAAVPVMAVAAVKERELLDADE
ncbi:DUF7210 family protein [Desulfoluna spongiiphila]|uniref:DUF7210 domain-containing protein n=1 Tax=Desulfoluna spongiiphila TaxID=419481 RepID=A0A1G5CFS4_9BACT|nr:hypothetical protein [Desulfoluna spongiiphila]SCY01375.1 hypothetical protein SAMN05216233_1034 [Desulfoluna spongiiphila]